MAVPVLNSASEAQQQGGVAADAVNLLARTMADYHAFSDAEKHALDELANGVLLARLTQGDGLQKRQLDLVGKLVGGLAGFEAPKTPSGAASSEASEAHSASDATYYGQSGQSAYAGGAGGSVKNSGSRIGGIVQPWGGVTGGITKIDTGAKGGSRIAGSSQSEQSASTASEASGASEYSDLRVETQ